ncbi:VOC family protein [Spiractinospora alimapuensis]|uniref:VOC family protein n=1 Tax=Spiractinospora alimapuensis TaxID=2820884 RepID=UPI001F220E69|nr:VOC family protein [Spiractinospora alimapuensis]QVQ50806.1 VOC family protein [Spiractinospora alimapuensis]
MITGFGISSVFVRDYEEAKEFFVEKLGFEPRFDTEIGEGFRWVTVGPAAAPNFQLNLVVPQPPNYSEEDSAAILGLLAKGTLSGGAWHTDDCRATHREYSARGVEFLQEPQERPYGVEAVFRDPSGNWYSLTQQSADAMDPQAMEKKFAG